MLIRTPLQLSKEEESDSTDAEVTREDQDKINTFSKLHNRSKILQEELSQKQVSLFAGAIRYHEWVD